MNLTARERVAALEQVAAETQQAISPPPDRPLAVIEPGHSWAAISFRELWAYRELFYFLIWRDIKVRYKQTALGVAWVVVQPLMTTLVFTLFFGVLAGIGQQVDVPYPVFAFAGLLPWTFFSHAVTNSGNSLVGSSNLITKVYFPRVIIPCAAVGAGLVDFGIAFAVLVGLMAFYGVGVSWAVLMLPPLVLLVTLFALGVGMWLSALNVKYRDIRYVMPFLLQMWMFASPVIYPPTFVPERWRWLLSLNPMTGIVDGFRAAVFGKPFGWAGLASSAAITLALLAYSAWAFARMEKSFADIV
jgi:homopolymeric O-antigen transport system permease protein